MVFYYICYMKFYLFFFLILFSCNTQDFILSSTYQHWVGGRPETGSGTNYRFNIVAPADDNNFKIESIKAHKKILKYSINPQEFNKGDTLKVVAYKSQEAWQSDTICKINYKLKGKAYSFTPKELKELERLLYP